MPVYSYKRFNLDDDILSTERSSVQGMFITTSSIASSSWGWETSSTTSTYFVKITGSSTTEGAYDIATVCYGASGTRGAASHTSESLTIYNQFTNFFVGRTGTGSADFNFSPTANASSSAPSGFMAICIARDRFGDQLEPGTWHIKHKRMPGTATATESFTDGASTSSDPVVRYGPRGRWDYVYSGSRKVGNTVGVIVGTEPVGMVFYDHGAIILNSLVSTMWTGSATTYGNSGQASGAGIYATGGLVEIAGYGISKLKSTLYFCRLGNREFNFSQNPTYYDASTGVIINSNLKNSPRTYVTSVGLYNDKDELIAIGKLDSPEEKSFTRELILSAQLDF